MEDIRDYPRPEDIAFYREHGYWVAPVLLPDYLLDRAQEAMDDIYSGTIDASDVYEKIPNRTGRPLTEWTAAAGGGLRKTGQASFRSRRLAELARHRELARIAMEFSGKSGIRLWHDQVLYKPTDSGGGASNVGWHTDRNNWRTSTSEEMLTIWVPLHDVDEVCGSITFIDGSHKLEIDPDDLNFYDQDLDRIERIGNRRVLELPRVTPRLKKGQFTVHHCRTVHGSGPNRSSAPRRSVPIHYQPTDNRYREVILPDDSHYYDGNDLMCRLADGHPDYGDPDLFPLLAGQPA